jgi:cell division protein ZipA
MNELRWILLGLGALFVVGLALWELRRQRHMAGDVDSGEPVDTQGWQDLRSEPALDIPEIRNDDLRRDPPLVMLDELHAADTDVGFDVAMEVAVDRPGLAVREAQLPAAIQWPPERQDHIIWLRVVPLGDARFSGKLLRQSLTGCGMVLGPQDIFHWADEAGQVVASAANLTRPGSFDLAAMDTQQFLGVHLFSVLPGPLPPAQTFDELLSLARDVAARVSGQVQDEQGRPVDAARVAELRDSLQPADRGDDVEDAGADA